MKIQANFTGAVLASLAFVLVIGLIEINELDRSGLAVQPVTDTTDSATVDSAVETREQPDCMQAEAELSAGLEQSRSCIVDADCTLASFECPFECVTPVGKVALDDLQRKEGSFQQSCQRCVSECPATLDQWRAACVRQQCIVLDRSIDELEEETLRLMDESG